MIKEDIEEEEALRQTIGSQELLRFTECPLCQALCWTLYTKSVQRPTSRCYYLVLAMRNSRPREGKKLAHSRVKSHVYLTLQHPSTILPCPQHQGMKTRASSLHGGCRRQQNHSNGAQTCFGPADKACLPGMAAELLRETGRPGACGL